MPIGIKRYCASLSASLRSFVERHGEAVAFCGDPGLQISPAEIDLVGARPVICSKTALGAFTAIVEQGEGALASSVGSHYQKFIAIREEFAALRRANPKFVPAFPAATNPVQRTPTRPEGRVWIENEEAAVAVDLANSGYALMLRLIAYSYAVPRPSPEKGLVVDLALGLMRAVRHLGERAARLPAGPSNPHCNAGMSFAILRDAAPLPRGPGARRFLTEWLQELAMAAEQAAGADARMVAASRILADVARRGERGLASVATEQPAQATPKTVAPAVATAAVTPATAPLAGASTTARTSPPVPHVVNGVDEVEADKLTLLYEGKKCIHARFCVTGAPKVFLANVKGPWIDPDAMDVELLAGIAHACPSGAIRYRRKDGRPDETAPLVNLVAIREAGPYAVRAEMVLNGEPIGFRATLCRCGASQNKPFCDGSHHKAEFTATGEPPTGTQTAMLAVRDGPLAIDPQVDGPLQVRGNLEITSGTGRVVARAENCRLCRCGASNTKPFCDGSHARIGFRAP